ncbi:hypothetical protein [Polynucleobacter sp.]|uniref:hypothetical protein n=1 Tax=Polynucleobacter sp. TaxID=2029855 RepID=UPI003F6982DA
MSKKDYEMIAKEIKMTYTSCNAGYETSSNAEQAQADLEKNAVEEVARNLACAFANDNPRFDIDRFLIACGIE